MAENNDVIRVLDSPLQVDGQQWNALLAAQSPGQALSPFMRHEYLAALHSSGCATPETGWTPRFFTLWQGDDLVAACPLYLKDHSYGEYVFDHAWAQAYHQHQLAYYPKAVVAVPFTPVPGPRLLARNAAARQGLLQALITWCQAQQLSSLHLLFAAEDDLAACVAARLMLRHTVQFHWRNVAPTLVTACTALPPKGAELARGGPSLRSMAPTLVAACTALPPEGACSDLGRPGVGTVAPTLVASRTALPPEGAELARDGPSLRSVAPTLVTDVSARGLAGSGSRDASPLSPVQSCSSSFGAAGSSPSGAELARGGLSLGSMAPMLCEDADSDLGRAALGPGHVVTRGYADFDDFLASLSQDKRKKIRQERRKVAEAGVRFRWSRGRDIRTADWEFFYRCYERTYHEHGNAPYLTPAFFQCMQSQLPEHWLLFVAEQHGQPIATSLVALSHDYSRVTGQFDVSTAGMPEKVAYGRYWGALARVDCLHFEACYYQPLQWCIAHGFARFEGGAQGEHKMARALLPVKTSSAHWLAHPAFADAVERFLDRESTGVAHYLQDLERRTPLRQR